MKTIPATVVNANMAWLGANNGTIPAGRNAAEAKALFITNYKLEVMKAFAKKCIFKDLHRVHTIDHGNSSTFYFTGKAAAHYHTPGQMILGTNNPPISKTVINVDGLLLADIMLDNLEEAMLHIDVRQEFSNQQGIALANYMDERIARLFYLAARCAPKNNDHPGGSVISIKDAGTDGAKLAAAIKAAALTLDEKDVPLEDRFIVVKPAQYYLLTEVKDLINRDYGGSGSIKDVQLQSIANMSIKKSMSLPNGKNITTQDDMENNVYTGDFTDSIAIVGNKNAVGTVKLKDVKVKMSGSEIDQLFEATLITASYAMGHGILDPRGAIEIADDPGDTQNTPYVVASGKVSSVTLSKSTTSLSVGGDETLTATVTADAGTATTVTWASSDTSKATVSSAGVVTGIAAGSATITATSTYDKHKKATCTVTVTVSGT